jgi:hypothetical protein
MSPTAHCDLGFPITIGDKVGYYHKDEEGIVFLPCTSEEMRKWTVPGILGGE